MNVEECAELLARISTVDRYAPKPSAMAAEGWASLLDDVPLPEALNACRAHYRAHTETVTAHDILAFVRSQRRDVSDREVLPALKARQGSERHDEHVDAIYAHMDWSAERRTAGKHPCPWCQSKPGQACTRPSRKADDGHVELHEPHPGRIALAVACPTCSARVGTTCEVLGGGWHPHQARERSAVGAEGLAKRKAVTNRVLAIAAQPDWEREREFVEAEEAAG